MSAHNRIIIVINGRAGGGKDTLVGLVKDILDGHGWRTDNLSSIKPIWDMLKSLGIPMDKKGEEERRLASEVKVALDNYHQYATRMCVERALSSMLGRTDHVVFLHMRELPSIAYARTLVPDDVIFKTLFLENNNVAPILSNSGDANIGTSDDYDMAVNNDQGMEELFWAAKHLVNIILNLPYEKDAA